MTEENYNGEQGKSREDGLSDSTEVVSGGAISGKGVDKQALYKVEKQNVEQGIEKSGEKIKQSLPVKLSSTTNENDKKSGSGGVDYHAQEIVKLDADEQVAHLVKIATNKNPYLAIEIAKHLRNNYVLAELHSDLTEEKMIDVLSKKGLL